MLSPRALFVGKNIGPWAPGDEASSLPAIAKGLNVELANSLDEAPNVVICSDFERSSLAVLGEARRKQIKTVLLAYEPSVVIPLHRLKKIRDLFDLVLEIGRPHPNQSIHWPQVWKSDRRGPSRQRKNRAIMVQSSKFSFVRGQLYGLRSELASKDKRLDLHGFGWNDSRLSTLGRLTIEMVIALKARAPLDFRTFRTAFLKPLNYLGSVEDKIQAMEEYQVALVIENSQEYITEKLFDAFFAGCIPVYVGPDLEKFDIPRHLYVRADPNPRSVTNALSEAFALDRGPWLESLDEFLARPEVRRKWDWKPATEQVLELALRVLDE